MIPAPFPLLLEGAARALVAATAVWGSLRILRVRNLVAQKAAWAMVLFASLAMPLVMWSHWMPAWADLKLPFPLWTRGVELAPPAAHLNNQDVSNLVSSEMETAPQSRSADEDRFPSQPVAAVEPTLRSAEESRSTSASVPGPARAATPARSSRFAHRFLAFAWIFYLAGCAVLLSRLLWGLATSLWLWFQAKPVELAANLGFPSSIHVGCSTRVASPVNIGSGILLPADHVEWDDEKLRVVLAHERSHVQQCDFYLQMLSGLYTALTWFSPLGWWLKHKLSELGEAISDRAGIEAAASPSDYAGMLLEFAALPRPTFNGVAMAHSSNLSHRIERFLNESTFRLAFAGGRRALLTTLIPAVLVATIALVRVQAAPGQSNALQPAALTQDQTTPQTPIAGQSNPQPAQATNSGPAPEPAAGPVPEAAQTPTMPSPGPAPEAAPAPPMPPAPGGIAMPEVSPVPPIHIDVNIPSMPPMPMMAFAGEGFCFPNGDSYVIVGEPGTKPHFCGNWDDERTRSNLEKARSMAHGHFLLFRHDGKLYILDDAATVSQIEAMEKSRQDIGDQMRALGKQMREDGAANARSGAQSTRVSRQDSGSRSIERDRGTGGVCCEPEDSARWHGEPRATAGAAARGFGDPASRDSGGDWRQHERL